MAMQERTTGRHNQRHCRYPYTTPHPKPPKSPSFFGNVGLPSNIKNMDMDRKKIAVGISVTHHLWRPSNGNQHKDPRAEDRSDYVAQPRACARRRTSPRGSPIGSQDTSVGVEGKMEDIAELHGGFTGRRSGMTSAPPAGPSPQRSISGRSASPSCAPCSVRGKTAI